MNKLHEKVKAEKERKKKEKEQFFYSFSFFFSLNNSRITDRKGRNTRLKDKEKIVSPPKNNDHQWELGKLFLR